MRFLDQELLNVPRFRRFGLSAVRTKPLVKISLPMQQGDTHHWDTDISG
jgi:hypothetical protein